MGLLDWVGLAIAALGLLIVAFEALFPGRLAAGKRKFVFLTGAGVAVIGLGVFSFWPAEMPAQVAASTGDQATEVTLTIPPPSGELSKFTSDDLVEGANVLAQVIVDYDKANENTAPDVKQKYYTARFAKPVKDMTEELNARIVGGISLPQPDPYLIGSGGQVAVSGKLAGKDSLAAVSNFLRFTALQVPRIVRRS